MLPNTKLSPTTTNVLPLSTSRLRPPHLSLLTATTTPLTLTSQTAYRKPRTEQQHQSTTRPIGSSARHNTTTNYTPSNSLSTMPPQQKQRKMAIVGSRSVGTLFSLHYPPQYNPYHLTRQTSPSNTHISRQILPHSPIRRRPLRRLVLPDHRKHFQQSDPLPQPRLRS